MRLGLWMAALALSSTTAFTAHVSASEVLSEAQIWKKTQLDATLTSRFINNQACISSELYLESCRRAVAAARALIHVPVADHQNDFETALADIARHLPAEVPVQMMRARAINAHLETFDPYAAIKATEEFRNTRLQGSKQYVGIGMAVEQAPDGIMIRETYPTSPASRAGLHKGDFITAIAADGRNFEDVSHLNVDLLADKIVGDNGEPLSIRVRRGEREIEFTNIKRAAVNVVYVNSEMIDPSTGLGYIRIRSFESIMILAQFKKQIRELRNRGMKKLVLDLRGNRGGDKSMAVQIAELFLGPKNLTGTKLLDDSVPSIPAAMNRESETYEKDIQWEPGFAARATYTFPLVVLIDSQSASASEILAGALQDHNRAWLVGETSYGKGSAQSMEPIPDYPSLTLKWTSERFYLPSGRSNQGIGIRPSFEVARDRDDADRMVPRLREVDNMPNALSPESRPWIETRPKRKAAISNCVTAYGAHSGIEDYQKAFAVTVLACSK